MKISRGIIKKIVNIAPASATNIFGWFKPLTYSRQAYRFYYQSIIFNPIAKLKIAIIANIKTPKPDSEFAGPATRYSIAINNVKIEPIIIRIIPSTFRIGLGINSNNKSKITTFPNY